MVQVFGEFLVANFKENQKPNRPPEPPIAKLHDKTESAAVRPDQNLYIVLPEKTPTAWVVL